MVRVRVSLAARVRVSLAASRGGAHEHSHGTHVKPPGAGRSLAEKETRKRSASVATRKLTLANCWRIFLLMSDQRACGLEARGERGSALYSAFYPQQDDNERGSRLQPGQAQQLAC